MKIITILLSFLLAGPAVAQLTVDQRAFDFQVLASLYAKRYAPLQWKRDALNVDALNIAPWLTRVRAAKDDVEFLELCKEYVASFDDAHTTFQAPGDLVADAGFYADIYDGKVYVDFIDRSLLPRVLYPIDPGDEVISIDGKPVEQAMAEIILLNKSGNSSTTRRDAAQLLTFRPASLLPRTVLLGESLEVELKQASGEARRFTIPWFKTGYSPEKIGPVLSPRTAASTRATAQQTEEDEDQDPWSVLVRAKNRRERLKVPSAVWRTRRQMRAGQNEETAEGQVLGYGSRTPSFTLPAGFQTRLGRSGADFHFSGTYASAGKRIGYLRIPDFDPPSAAAAAREVAGEVAFFRQNTDGLVVDVQRNPGGYCQNVIAAARYLIPQRFWTSGEEHRPTADLVGDYQRLADLARDVGAEQWLIDTIDFQFGMIKTAYAENRGMTGPIPTCSFLFEADPATDPAGRVLAYEKPLIVLIDEYSASAGDLFPAMIQDNKRGPLVGTRTTGAGGSVTAWDTGFFMEGKASNTNSLLTRREPRAVAGYPTSHYIENVGVHPDILLERMTVENLRSRGREFVDEFTRIIVEEINKATP